VKHHVVLSDLELNYIEGSLYAKLREYSESDAGNIPELRKITRRTLRKIELIRRPKVIFANYQREGK
jgi:pilus assembly protein TadC